MPIELTKDLRMKVSTLRFPQMGATPILVLKQPW